MPKLTKRFVDLIQPPTENPGKDLFLWDAELPGFGVRVKASGIKSYLIQYRQSGRSRRMTIGRHGVLTAEEARRRARLELGSVANGKDPARTREESRRAPTVKELASDYIDRHATPNKRLSSIRDDRAMLNTIILPRLGAKKVKEVARRDVEAILLAMKETPYRANRVRALLSKMFALAVAWNWRPDNPVLGIPKYQEHKRERWLSREELERLAAVLDVHSNQRAANIVRLLVLTGARKSEVMRATWEQFDLDRGVWTKPAHTTKQRRTAHTPLNEQALFLVRNMQAVADDNCVFLFPGDRPDQPITDIKRFWHDVRGAANIPDARLHDLRHTFASHLVSEGVSLPIIGRLLGHTQAQTTQRYAHLADKPLRAATNLFGGKSIDGKVKRSRTTVVSRI